ncbi:MAG: hypothetical protein ACTSWY_05015 [Promethearchaeota archaeon]
MRIFIKIERGPFYIDVHDIGIEGEFLIINQHLTFEKKNITFIAFSVDEGRVFKFINQSLVEFFASEKFMKIEHSNEIVMFERIQ